MNKRFKINECYLHYQEKWNESCLVTYPVSYKYNGGIIINNKWYEGYEVPKPKVPKGFKLVGIGCGLQLNTHPPYATSYLKPIDGKKRTANELKTILTAIRNKK
jgi:hypothetical protein